MLKTSKNKNIDLLGQIWNECYDISQLPAMNNFPILYNTDMSLKDNNMTSDSEAELFFVFRYKLTKDNKPYTNIYYQYVHPILDWKGFGNNLLQVLLTHYPVKRAMDVEKKRHAK